MNLTRLLWIVAVLFPVSEIVLAFRRRADPIASRVEDRGSLRLLWFVIGASVSLAIVLQGVSAARLNLSPTVCHSLSLGFIISGLVIRWLSIVRLGRLFTVDVAIHTDHALVQGGLYRYVRHPSYTGLLLAFLGLAVFFANWLSVVAVVVPITLAVLKRISIEEEALRKALGPSYAAYCARTKRFIPGLL